jgi:hypothetical protein
MSEKENEAEALAKTLEAFHYGALGMRDVGRDIKSAASLLRSQAERIRELEGALEEVSVQPGPNDCEGAHWRATAARTALRGEKEKVDG